MVMYGNQPLNPDKIGRNDTMTGPPKACQHSTREMSCGCRGVQYVHWVMHKCILVKVGGEKYR